ncbi:MAG: redoxin domain-containing protein [Anaerolineae bacterium]|nr:redoxin domain-containing protein [Anaerolineae bacterium]
MKQIVDLHNDPQFQTLNVALVSIAFDSREEQVQLIQEYGITGVPMAIDADHSVSKAYDVLKWAVGTGEPSHTFVLVDSSGKIAWIKDYGAPDKPDRTMYVPPAELVREIKLHLR